MSESPAMIQERVDRANEALAFVAATALTLRDGLRKRGSRFLRPAELASLNVACSALEAALEALDAPPSMASRGGHGRSSAVAGPSRAAVVDPRRSRAGAPVAR